MNKTFKVVFNKARGALMVVNEATSSVQKKGTKTVIVAVAVMIAGVAGTAMAAHNADSSLVIGDTFIAGSSTPENYDSFVTGSITEINVGEVGKSTVIKPHEGEVRGFNINKNVTASLSGSTIEVTGTERAINTGTSAKVTIGGEKTSSITVTQTEKSSYEAEMALSAFSDSQTTLTAKDSISIFGNARYAVFVNRGSDDVSMPTTHTKLTLTAENITITNKYGKGAGVTAFSNGELQVNGNLTVNAARAIHARGNSLININTDGKHSTVLNGDIVFESDAPLENSSGHKINSELPGVPSTQISSELDAQITL